MSCLPACQCQVCLLQEVQHPGPVAELTKRLKFAESERDYFAKAEANEIRKRENAEKDRDAARAALTKINDIRNSIVGSQQVNWSEHVYPLVAALNDAGLDGQPYPEAQKYIGSLINQANRYESERDAALVKLAQLEADAAAIREKAERARRFLDGFVFTGLDAEAALVGLMRSILYDTKAGVALLERVRRLDDVEAKSLPNDAQVLSVQMQWDQSRLWALVDDEEVLEKRRFRVFGTGQRITALDALELRHVGTWVAGVAALLLAGCVASAEANPACGDVCLELHTPNQDGGAAVLEWRNKPPTGAVIFNSLEVPSAKQVSILDRGEEVCFKDVAGAWHTTDLQRCFAAIWKTLPLAATPRGPKPGQWNLGDVAHTWTCARLPPIDFTMFNRVYCTDANGRLVKLLVESVTKRKR